MIRRLVAGGLAALTVASGLLAVAAGEAAAGAVKAGYAVVNNVNLPGSYSSLPSGSAYNSHNLASPAYVKRTGPGVYKVFFAGLQPAAGETKGIAHAGSRDGSSYCATDGAATSSEPGVPGIAISVYCHSYLGNLYDAPFAVSYAGGAEAGGLVNVRFAMEQYFSPLGPVFQPLAFHSTVGGSATVTPNGGGYYTIDLPLLPGSEPETYQLTAEPGAEFTGEPVTDADRYPMSCGILATTEVSSPSRQRLTVRCVGVDGQFNWIYALNVTYARGINTIGKGVMATGYATVPLLTSPTNGLPVPGKNKIYGVSGAITVDRAGTGMYIVHFKNLSWGITKPAAFATAIGSPARCVTMTGAAMGDEGTAFVYCRNKYFDYVDTSFAVQYLTRG